jgi:hypothetical protein
VGSNAAGIQRSVNKRKVGPTAEAVAFPAAAARVKAESDTAAKPLDTPVQAGMPERRKPRAAGVGRVAVAKVSAAAAAGIKADPSGAADTPDTPPQADKRKRSRKPRAATAAAPISCKAVKREEAGPSAPEQDACAGPSESPRVTVRSNCPPGQAPRIKKEEVVDLTADSPRASSCTQMPGAHAEPAERVPSGSLYTLRGHPRLSVQLLL